MDAIKQQLLKKISENNVVLFIGAGISMNAGLPSWKDLVISILDGLVAQEPKSEKFKQALEDELLTPIEILQKITHLKEQAIEHLDEQIRMYDDRPFTTIHQKLGELSSRIITTNYDILLEAALPNFEKVNYNNTYKVAKLSQYKKYIYKIHGDIHEPDACILFPEQYESLYSAEEKSSTFELKKIISDKSILFIGFSLTDPYVNFVFEYIQKIYSGFNPEHFIVTSDKGRNWPKKVNPIFIEKNSDLEPLLDELIEAKRSYDQDKIDLKEKFVADSTTGITKISDKNEFDSPPINKFWVGREREIENINNGNFKAIFITGIGGQGKSALAAHYIRNNFDAETFEFADWRDFKEEANRFNTKIISIIKRLTPDTDSGLIENLSNELLVDQFFHILDDRRIIFVFDNIDKYIDLVTFKPTGAFGYFYEKILNGHHRSRFIFTCRPFIREAGVDFYQIRMSGISSGECLELFKLYKISISDVELKSLSDRAHQLTKGHPLWLNLIAGQAMRGVGTVEKFITEIEGKTSFNEDNFSSILSEKILDVVWNGLNDKQKTLIRGIAETVKPESEEDLKMILESELNANQFYKALRVLKNINLIETLDDGEIELHPLVKEYVKSKYQSVDRAKFITLFVKFYDRFIYILKPNLNSKLSLHEFQYWTSKIELQINKGDFRPALVALEEVSYSLISAGFSDEYLRVSEKLFETINWDSAINDESPYFYSQFNKLTTELSQMGRYVEVDRMLVKYKLLIPGKSVQYLVYCSEKVYALWCQGKHKEAIQIGEEGVSLLEESGLTDNYNLKHNLALTYRDSKTEANLRKAISHFLHNEQLEDFLKSDSYNEELGGGYYGNLGKCLEYLGDTERALRSYLISLRMLLLEESTNAILNMGFACLWIGDLLRLNNQAESALYFLKFAKVCWGKTSPPRLKEVNELWHQIQIGEGEKVEIDSASDWRVRNFCSSYINQNVNKPAINQNGNNL